MKVIFKGNDKEYTYDLLQAIFTMNGLTMSDELNVKYDELNGDKRIIITRCEDESK